jgi:hypothetical protein
MKKIIPVALLLAFFSCKKDPDFIVDCSGPAKSFATDVASVIQASCANGSGCHGAGSKKGPGPLLNYSQVFNARSEIRSAVASGDMPRNGTLTVSEKNAILCWIDNGAPNI